MSETEMSETADYDKSAIPTAHASNHESGGADPIDNLGPLTGLTISGDGVITWQGASALSLYLFDSRVSGDTQPRFRIRADGQLEWGSGSSALDTIFKRGWADAFTIDDALIIYDSMFTISRQPGPGTAFQLRVSGLTYNIFEFNLDSSILFGSGSSALDCKILRRAANILNTPDRFEVGTLGVGNSANATTPGNCQKKVELFDSAGNSLGFLAVYDAIT